MLMQRFSSVLRLSPTIQNVSFSRSLSTQVNEVLKSAPAAKEEKIVMAKKTNIAQSPLRMKFLARLVRDTWVPDAMAQMKFSPKHRAEDILKIIKVKKNYFKFLYLARRIFG